MDVPNQHYDKDVTGQLRLAAQAGVPEDEVLKIVAILFEIAYTKDRS